VEVPTSRAEGTERIAGPTARVGSTDIARRVLSEDDVKAILRSQIEEHSRAASEYVRIGRPRACVVTEASTPSAVGGARVAVMGASGGLGGAIAQLLASRGARLILA
jgi:predicted amino acid dehydrogenase